VYVVVADVVVEVTGFSRSSSDCYPADWWRHAASTLL